MPTLESMQAALEKVEEIARHLKKHADDPSVVKRAADDLEAIARYGSPVTGLAKK